MSTAYRAGLASLWMLACWLLTAGGGLADQAKSSVSVWTYHYDNWRTGWNAKESILSPGAIANGAFGLLRTVHLDDDLDQIDAQPLVVSDIAFDGQSREVVYVATEDDNVYAIDGESGKILRKRRLGEPIDIHDCGNNGPKVGVNSTPVIDLSSQTMYVMAFLFENNVRIYKLFALELGTLKDRVPPRIISASNVGLDGSTISFVPEVSRQRPALVLNNGAVYAAFGSFCDNDWDVSRGWLLGWRADDLSPLQTSHMNDHRVNTKQRYYLASIWMSGYGPASDAAGNLYFVSGNSRFDDDERGPTAEPNSNWPDSVVKVSADLSKVIDFYTPPENQMGMPQLDADDREFGSGGILLVPDNRGSGRRLAVAAGKPGRMYLLDRDNLGGYTGPGANHALGVYDIGACWCGPSFFTGADGLGRVVSSGEDDLKIWRVASLGTRLENEYSAKLEPRSIVFQRGFFTSVSSDGQLPGSAVIWAVQRPTTEASPGLTLYAFDAKDGAILRSLSGGPWPAGPWPNTGGGANAVPVVANGHVFVASNRELRIFGLGAKPARIASSGLISSPIPAARKLYGTIAAMQEGVLWLQTRSTLVSIDMSKLDWSGRSAVLTQGQAVVVRGSMDDGGAIAADAICDAPRSPDLWPTDK